jgi:hypothetical protein
MTDLSAQYDALYGELTAMSGGIGQCMEMSEQVRTVVNGLPDTVIGGAVLMGLVTYLQGVQQRLDQALAHYMALVQAAEQAVHVIEEADSGLQAIAPRW